MPTQLPRAIITLPKDLMPMVRKAASADGRSISNWIVQLIREEFKEAPGAIPPESAFAVPAAVAQARKGAKGRKSSSGAARKGAPTDP